MCKRGNGRMRGKMRKNSWCCRIIHRCMKEKSEGKIEVAAGMFFLCFLLVASAMQIQLRLFQTTSLYMEDALAASNLASAVVDIEAYGSNHEIYIAAPAEAFEIYKKALKLNLQLDDSWECAQKDLITGRVEILRYIIYNVRGQDIMVHCFGTEGVSVYEEKGGLGSVRTPDGTLVESTTVYSRIGFPVEGILGVSVYAEKDKSVDIVAGAA